MISLQNWFAWFQSAWNLDLFSACSLKYFKLFMGCCTHLIPLNAKWNLFLKLFYGYFTNLGFTEVAHLHIKGWIWPERVGFGSFLSMKYHYDLAYSELSLQHVRLEEPHLGFYRLISFTQGLFKSFMRSTFILLKRLF